MQQFHDPDPPTRHVWLVSVAGRAGISEESDSRALKATIHGSRGALHRHAEPQAHRHYRVLRRPTATNIDHSHSAEPHLTRAGTQRAADGESSRTMVRLRPKALGC